MNYFRYKIIKAIGAEEAEELLNDYILTCTNEGAIKILEVKDHVINTGENLLFVFIIKTEI